MRASSNSDGKIWVLVNNSHDVSIYAVNKYDMFVLFPGNYGKTEL